MQTRERISTPPSPARILVVDDHPIVRRGIRQLLGGENDLVICGEADSPATTLAALDSTDPHLVIVDLTLARANGLGLIRDIQSQRPGLPVLVLSMHDETFYAERVLRAGAVGYIMKQEATDHIVEAIRQVLDGRIWVSERMSARMLHRLVGEPRRAERAGPQALTDRELEVLQLLGTGLTTRQIATQLFLSIKTVETHLDHLKTKLGLESGRELVRHAMRWLLEGS